MYVEYTEAQKNLILEKMKLIDSEIEKIQEQMIKFGISELRLPLASNSEFRFSESSEELWVGQHKKGYHFFDRTCCQHIHYEVSSFTEARYIFGADLIRNWKDVKRSLNKQLDEKMLGVTVSKLRDVELQEDIDTYLENFSI